MRRSQAWKIGAGFLVLALLLVLALAGGYAWVMGARWNLARHVADDPALDLALGEDSSQEPGTNTSAPPSPEADHEAMNILLLGSDSRDDEVDYATGAGYRTDAIMLLHVPADRGGVQVLSIPRDTKVEIPERGTAKIGEASAHDGLAGSVTAVSDLLETPIDHVVAVDFEGFAALTDLLGGVDVEVDEAFDTGDTAFVEGVNHLDGEAALDFVRARRQFAEGDLARVAHQQEYLRAVSTELLDDKILFDPSLANDLISEIGPYVTMDEDLDASRIVSLLTSLRGADGEDLVFATVPIAGAVEEDGKSYLLVDDLTELRSALDEDSVDEYVEARTDDDS